MFVYALNLQYCIFLTKMNACVVSTLSYHMRGASSFFNKTHLVRPFLCKVKMHEVHFALKSDKVIFANLVLHFKK